MSDENKFGAADAEALYKSHDYCDRGGCARCIAHDKLVALGFFKSPTDLKRTARMLRDIADYFEGK